MIYVVADDYEAAWRYLSRGVPEPVFKVILTEAHAEGIDLPVSVVNLSERRELYDKLVQRMEEAASVPVRVPLHLLATPLRADQLPLAELGSDDHDQALGADQDEAAVGDQADDLPARVVAEDDVGQDQAGDPHEAETEDHDVAALG